MAIKDGKIEISGGYFGTTTGQGSGGQIPRRPKDAHLVSLDKLKTCLRAVGFAFDEGSNNVAVLRMITEEFNRAQNALREEVQEIAARVNTITTKAEVAASKYEPPPQKPGMRVWQCIEAGCTRAKYTSVAPPVCYTCGKTMCGIVMNSKSPAECVDMPTPKVSAPSIFSSEDIVKIVTSLGGRDAYASSPSPGLVRVAFSCYSTNEIYAIWIALATIKPVGIRVQFDVKNILDILDMETAQAANVKPNSVSNFSASIEAIYQKLCRTGLATISPDLDIYPKFSSTRISVVWKLEDSLTTRVEVEI